jgi:hypothetical protein
MKTNLVIDLSNIAWIARFSEVKKGEQYSRELITAGILNIIKYSVMEYKPDGIIVACDSRKVWRKEIYPEYKAHRDEERDEFFLEVRETIDTVTNFFNTCTSVPAVAVPRAEADDIIAVVCKYSPHKTVVVSTDKDFIQLLDSKTRLYSPTLKGERTSENVGFDLFEKCIRGDTGDNIFSALPRVRKTVLEAAYNDPLAMANLMESRRKTDGAKVADVYEFNRKLIDLNLIPQDVVDAILNELAKVESGDGYGRYNHIKTLQFFGKNNLKKLAEEESKFAEILKRKFVQK